MCQCPLKNPATVPPAEISNYRPATYRWQGRLPPLATAATGCHRLPPACHRSCHRYLLDQPQLYDGIHQLTDGVVIVIDISYDLAIIITVTLITGDQGMGCDRADDLANIPP